MIELVFAIVIIGIAVMSLPLVLTQTQNNNNFALRQEVILSIESKLAYILSYEWDSRTYDANASIERVLDTNASTGANNAFYTNTIRRKGHINADNRRRLFDALTSPTTKANFGMGGTTPQDIDDFDGIPPETKTITALDDFIFNLTLDTTVDYVSDAPIGGTNYTTSSTISFVFPEATTNTITNIKMIKVTGTANGIDPINMYAFSSNIGQSKITKRTW